MQNINELRDEFINAHSEALLPTAVISAYTGLSLSWFNCRAVSGGGIPYTKIGKNRQYKKQDVLDWLAEHTKKQNQQPNIKRGCLCFHDKKINVP